MGKYGDATAIVLQETTPVWSSRAEPSGPDDLGLKSGSPLTH